MGQGVGGMCPASTGQGPHSGSSEHWLCPFASPPCHLLHKVRSVAQSTVNICGAELKNICPRRSAIQGTSPLQVGKPQGHKRALMTAESGLRIWGLLEQGGEERDGWRKGRKKGERMGKKGEEREEERGKMCPQLLVH